MRCALILIATTLAIAGQFTTSISAAYPDLVSAIATDSSGNTYVVGSRQLPGTASFVNPRVFQNDTDVFLTKLDPTGKVLFTDTFGGKGVDTGTAVTVDSSGNIYITGTTTSPDFPVSRALQTQIYAGGTGSGFVMKLSGDGTAILYSTFFGGTLGQSAISALATDSNGNLYLTGYTEASDFPHTTGMPFGNITQSPAVPGAIIASISADGSKILYSGAIVMPTPCTSADPSCISNGGIQWEGVGIALDAAGNAYIAGNDPSVTKLATTAGVLTPNGIGAFVAKVNAGGTGLGYLTYIGSGAVGNSPFLTADTSVYAIAVDAAGNVFLAGQTLDPDFPATPGAYQSTGQIYGQGFLAKLNSSGSAMVWATFLAGAAPESIAIDATENVWLTGTTLNSTFPNANGWTTGAAFLAEVNAAGSKLAYSALYPANTVGQSVAVDPSGLIHFAGSAGFISSMAPTAPGMTIFDFQNAAGGNITAQLSPAEVIAIYGPGIGPSTPVTATPANGFYPTTLAGVQVAINGANIPLLYVSQNQINAVSPMELTPNAAATVHVINGTKVSPDYAVWMVGSTPQAFAPTINQDGSVNSQSNPAHGGSIVTFFATGWQSSFAPLTDGQAATGADDFCLGHCQASAGYFQPPMCLGFCFARPAVVPMITITATVQYGGAAPTLVAGITQFNVLLGTLPASSGTNPFTVSVTSNLTGFAVSQGVWIAP